jgi:hypothetical protein
MKNHFWGENCRKNRTKCGAWGYFKNKVRHKGDKCATSRSPQKWFPT